MRWEWDKTDDAALGTCAGPTQNVKRDKQSAVLSFSRTLRYINNKEEIFCDSLPYKNISHLSISTENTW